jgi:hypothetical protein
MILMPLFRLMDHFVYKYLLFRLSQINAHYFPLSYSYCQSNTALAKWILTEILLGNFD